MYLKKPEAISKNKGNPVLRCFLFHSPIFNKYSFKRFSIRTATNIFIKQIFSPPAANEILRGFSPVRPSTWNFQNFYRLSFPFLPCRELSTWTSTWRRRPEISLRIIVIVYWTINQKVWSKDLVKNPFWKRYQLKV